MTPPEIIYRHRFAVLDHARTGGNVAETFRIFGISRTRYYEWRNRAERNGLEALMPKERRRPGCPRPRPLPRGGTRARIAPRAR